MQPLSNIMAGGLMLAALLLTAPGAAAQCTGDDLAKAVNDAGAALRKLSAENTPRLFDVKAEIVCERGTLYLDGGPGALQVFAPGEAACPDTFVSPTVQGRAVGFDVESINHFIDCVADDTRPDVGFTRFRIARAVVDLPHPDSPTRPYVSPARTEKLTPSTARTRPCRRLKIGPRLNGK